ncbi:MAG TPA: DUF1844 domain-containing protein [Kofleriaceae bacterium]|nr:DUF1844 domain-containing protein [Kofleriaceae bacterium]
MMVPEPPKDPGAPPATDDPEPPRALPPLDFSTYVLSLASSAMVCLGALPAPGKDDAPGEADLPAAKQIIDILGILEDKTRGNLSEPEQKLLQSVLYDLRVRYVDARVAK